MSMWRPTEPGCLYVIPDIHGMYDQLQLILNRILPLRNTGGVRDHLIFLGDYVDRNVDSHKVIDLVMEVKENQPSQVTCLNGNHEMLFLTGISPTSNATEYLMWMRNGGEQTLRGYLDRAGSNIENVYLLDRKRIHSLIPKEHVRFITFLESYYETDDYIFVHGGCDPLVPLQQQDRKVLAWDRSMYYAMWSMAENKALCPWMKTVVTGHNTEKTGETFYHDKYMMIDSSGVEKLNIFEMHSRKGFSARKGKKRLVKEKLDVWRAH